MGISDLFILLLLFWDILMDYVAGLSRLLRNALLVLVLLLCFGVVMRSLLARFLTRGGAILGSRWQQRARR
jgi:hypothetical protein